MRFPDGPIPGAGNSLGTRIDTIQAMRVQAHTAGPLAAIFGAALWVGLAFATGRREAWDDGAYYGFGIPACMALACALGFLCPERPWRWGALIFAGQALANLALHPTGSLLPLGLAVFALLSLPAAACSAAGGWLRRRLSRRPGDGSHD